VPPFSRIAAAASFLMFANLSHTLIRASERAEVPFQLGVRTVRLARSL
jgi:hypothetical protein